MTVEHPRVRLVVGRHGRPLAAGLALLAVLSLVGAGAVYLDRPTATVTEQTRQRSVETTTASSAVVTGEGALWPRGTVLSDQPVYLVNATPRVNVTARTTVSGAERATVGHEIVLSIRAVRDEEAFYTDNRTLAANTEDGTTVTTSATVDVREVRRRVRNVSERIGTAGTVAVALTVRTTYETDPGESYGYEGAENLSTGVTLTRNAYAIEEHPSARTDHATEVTTEVTRPRDWGAIWALALAGLSALGLAGAILQQRPASIDLEQARHDLHRRQYGQWISPGIIPMGIDQQFIELTSLEGVVDVAIDTQERVVYDARRELYAVISENVVYYFSPGGSWMETAFPGMSGGPDGDGGGGPGDGDAGGIEDAFDGSVFDGHDAGGPDGDGGGPDGDEGGVGGPDGDEPGFGDAEGDGRPDDR